MVLKCPNCKSEKTIKRGFRYNEVGKKQRYSCLECGQWFIDDDGFKRMRNKSKIITRAIHMHNDGMSLFDVTNHLWQYDGVKVTRMSISNWTKKYSVFLKSNKKKSKTET